MLLSADIGQVPVASRPVDFSGAIGGPFEVQYRLDDHPVVGQPYRFSIQIKGPGQFAAVKPFDMKWMLSDLIVDQASTLNFNNQELEINYVVRFRNAGSLMLPRLKFVYFNPKLRTFQTTYSDQPTIDVLDARSVYNVIAPELQEWATRHWVGSHQNEPVKNNDHELIRRILNWIGIQPKTHVNLTDWLWLFWLLPPLVSVALFFVKRQPTAYEAALARLNRPNGVLASSVAETLLQFLRNTGAISKQTVDAHEAIAQLRDASDMAQVLIRCESIRFGNQSSEFLQADAIDALRNWRKT